MRKSDNTLLFILIAILSALVVLLFYLKKEENALDFDKNKRDQEISNSQEIEEVESGKGGEKESELKVAEPILEDIKLDPLVVEKRGENLAVSNSKVEESTDSTVAIEESFAKVFMDMKKCLAASFEFSGGRLSPDVENLIGNIQGSFGETVYKKDNWEVAVIEMPDHEKRQLRVDYETDSEGVKKRKLTYTKIDEKGLSIPIVLQKDQIEDPSDTFIESLLADGKEISREKSKTIIFENGEELGIKEVNQQVRELDLSRLGKSYHCTGTDSLKPECQCHGE